MAPVPDTGHHRLASTRQLFADARLARLNIYDKIQHFASYAVLAFLPAIHERPRVVKAVVFGLIGLGVLLEVGQLLESRDFEIRDMAANTIGVFVGIAAGWPVRKYVTDALTARSALLQIDGKSSRLDSAPSAAPTRRVPAPAAAAALARAWACRRDRRMGSRARAPDDLLRPQQGFQSARTQLAMPLFCAARLAEVCQSKNACNENQHHWTHSPFRWSLSDCIRSHDEGNLIPPTARVTRLRFIYAAHLCPRSHADRCARRLHGRAVVSAIPVA
jgi:hypothetical protein